MFSAFYIRNFEFYIVFRDMWCLIFSLLLPHNRDIKEEKLVKPTLSYL
jgi:hypothetical protein